MDYLIPSIIVAVSVVAAAFLLRVWKTRATTDRQAEDSALSMLQSQIHANTQQSAEQLARMQNTLNETLRDVSLQIQKALSQTNQTVDTRLEATTRVIGDVRQRLGELDQSSKRMLDIGKDIAKLDEILRPPKLRGALGELFLADLLDQILPRTHYRLQYAFKGGETVDAVVLLRSGIVPIDAKFPLENFRRIFSAQSENERKTAKKSFVKDVKRHLDSISAKYIRTDENTFDFALMYIPAENVYYETIIKDDAFGGDMSLFNYSLKRRVIPVSPNSFYAYLQTIILGLKGMQVEEHSREILQGLARIQKEFDRFSDAFRLVGQHLDNSSKKYMEAQQRFTKMESKVEQLDGLAKGLEILPPDEAEKIPSLSP